MLAGKNPLNRKQEIRVMCSELVAHPDIVSADVTNIYFLFRLIHNAAQLRLSATLAMKDEWKDSRSASLPPPHKLTA